MIHSRMMAARSEVAAEHGVATGGHELEAEAGVRMMQAGGNAVDAVVAAAFTGCVVEPNSCGLGGYGRLSLYLADRQEFVTIDHNVRAPLAARPELFEIDRAAPTVHYGFPPTVDRQAEVGYLAAAVPGTVAGLCAAHEMFGRLPLAQVLEPAIEAAEAGLPITWNIVLAIHGSLDDIRRLPHAAAMLLRDGGPPKLTGHGLPRERLDLPDLARTLRLIAARGAAGFYSGAVAEAIARAAGAQGGILSAADLAAYRPKVLREKPARYRGLSYIAANDPVSYEALNILDQFDLAAYGPDSVEFRHLAAEAAGHAYRDVTMHYGDPDFARSPVNALCGRAFGAARAAGLRLDRAAPRPIAPADPWPYEDAAQAPDQLPHAPARPANGGTSQMAAADRAGNVAALFTTLNGNFGSLAYVPEAGVFLNNAMENYSAQPGLPNSIAPGKMPISSGPALVAVRAGRAVFGGCGSGGYRIVSGVLHAFMHCVDFGMGVQAAVDAPRVHNHGEETYVDSRIDPALRARLAEMGHEVVVWADQPGATHFARVNAIQIDPKTGLLRASAGPAWLTGAAGF